MIGSSGASVEWIGTTIVETSGGALSTGASATGGGCWDAPQAARSASALMTESRMRPVRVLQRVHLLLGQRDVERAEGLLELRHLRGADDRRGHARLVKDPRQRDLRRRNAARLRQR